MKVRYDPQEAQLGFSDFSWTLNHGIFETTTMRNCIYTSSKGRINLDRHYFSQLISRNDHIEVCANLSDAELKELEK